MIKVIPILLFCSARLIIEFNKLIDNRFLLIGKQYLSKPPSYFAQFACITTTYRLRVAPELRTAY